jgi:hypothetical protein
MQQHSSTANSGRPSEHPRRPEPSSRWRGRSAAESYAILVGAFLALRGAGTLLAGASFAEPGDGWRSIYQLAVAAILLLSLRSRASAATAVLGVGAFYALITVLGLLGGHDILGLAPVDTRDKILHPLLALTGLWIGGREAAATGGRSGRPAPSA